MKKYKVSWSESRKYICSVDIEAESQEEAYDLASFVDTPDNEAQSNECPTDIEWLDCKELK